MACEECGNRALDLLMVENVRLYECQLCGHLHGEDAVVALELERREASDLGWQPELLGLTRVIEKVAGLKLERVQPGDVERGVMPTIFFALTKSPNSTGIRSLVASLTIASTKTRHRWILELTYQHHLMLVLRPRIFHPLDIVTPSEVEQALEDVKRLRDDLRRDMNLPWWNHG